MLIPDLTRVPAQFRDYLGRLGTIAVDHLGDDLLGIYLIGSAAQGVYEHELSDVDVMIVSASRHPEHARRALAEQIVYPTLPCPTVGLECVWYAAPDLDPLGDPVMFQLSVNGGPKRARTIELEPGDEPQWWAVLDLAAARAVGGYRSSAPRWTRSYRPSRGRACAKRSRSRRRSTTVLMPAAPTVCSTWLDSSCWSRTASGCRSPRGPRGCARPHPSSRPLWTRRCGRAL